MKKLLILVLTTCLGAALPAFAGNGLCLWERWDTQSGGVDAMLTRTTAPAESALLTTTLWDVGDPSEYLARITLWLEAPTTGNYQFRIATDDNARLWLSSDGNPGNAVWIAGYDGWADVNQWNKYASQTSASIPLEAGKVYFLRGAHNEGGGGDHIHMQWQGPGFGWQTITGPAMSSTFPIGVEWGGERLVEYEVRDLVNAGADATSGLNAPPYPGGYPAVNPSIADLLDLILATEGNPDEAGYLTTFALPASHAPDAVNYFATRERAVLKLDRAGLYSFATYSDDNSLIFVGDWWDPAAELTLVAHDDTNHGVRWRTNVPAIDLDAGYIGITAWQYEHSGGAGLSAAYQGTGMGRTEFGFKNLVSPVDASMHSPVNGTINVPLDAVLSWEPPFGAASTEVKVYVWEQGAAQGAGVLTSATSHDPVLAIDKAYWWQVNAFDPNEGGNPVETNGKKLSFGTVTSGVFITAGPQGGGVDLGGGLELSVAATSAVMPLSYKWKKDGTEIGGADQATYAIAGMARSDNGIYSCAVSNGVATAESAGARVFLKELMAYWPLDADLADHAEELDPAAAGDKDAVYMVNDPNTLDGPPDMTVPYITGRVGNAIDFNGQTNFAYAGTWNPTAASVQLTVEFWAKWKGSKGNWEGPIGKRDTWNGADMMWQIELDEGNNDVIKTLQSTVSGGSQVMRLPAVGSTNVAATAIISYSAQHPTNVGEQAWRAFDGRKNTKWLAFVNTAWIQATFADMKVYVVTSYAITSGNDADGRDPDNWTLQGSNDGATWDILDTKTGAAGSWTARNQTVTFDLSGNATAYRMYKLDITKARNPSLNMLQLSELELFAANPIADDGWAFVTTTWNGTSATTYINGLAVRSANMAMANDTAASVVFGGCEANPTDGNPIGSKPWGGNLFNGALDEVKIYNYALSQQEVLQNYYAVADGDPVCLSGTAPAMDRDGNCVVDLADLVLFVSQWLQNNSAE
jgi:hypothetical protein